MNDRPPYVKALSIPNFWRSLLAIVAGNLIYYSMMRFLPAPLQHQIYRVDLGLALDFCLCVACYALVKRIWQ
jgi:hypothetical protein